MTDPKIEVVATRVSQKVKIGDDMSENAISDLVSEHLRSIGAEGLDIDSVTKVVLDKLRARGILK